MNAACGVVDHIDKVDSGASSFQPFVIAGVPLHQLSPPWPPLAPQVDFPHSSVLGLPQQTLDHPTSHRFPAHCDLMIFAEVLAGQRWAEPVIDRLCKDAQCLGLDLLVYRAV